MPNYYLLAVLLILIGGYIVNFIVERMDAAHASPELPREFEGYYDAGKYRQSQSYLQQNIRFGLMEDAVFTAGIVIFILAGGFAWIDGFARSFQQSPLVTGLIFFGVVYLAYEIFTVPFAAYRTFVIEEKYGFNRTTLPTFLADIGKGMLLAVVLGGVLLAAVLWFFSVAGPGAWFYSWMAVTAFQLFIVFIAPVVILPLFNKFTPLAEGELKAAITAYARSQDFALQGIYTMDASRRSAKANAFFTGFGRYKRIVLFDTLVANMTTEELVAVLAHEIGHYKHRDMLKSLAASTAVMGLMFFALSFILHNERFFAAFRMEDVSVYAGLCLFGFLFQPVQELFAVGTHYMSRRFEYRADRFSVDTYWHPEAMVSALKRLTVDNLGNLTPHPWKVFLAYSHPPVLERIRAIRERRGGPAGGGGNDSGDIQL